MQTSVQDLVLRVATMREREKLTRTAQGSYQDKEEANLR
jgi:hypothetical protein